MLRISTTFITWSIVLCLSISSIQAQMVQLDPKFNPYDDGQLGDGFDGTVRTLVLQNDGKLIVGGEFLNFNGAKSPYLCRLNSDGSKDSNFTIVNAFNGKIYSSVLQPNGKIIVAGAFTQYNGKAVGRIVRLNSDGTLDNSFDTSIAVTSGTIYGLALQSDGKLIVVGTFTKYNNLVANRITRLQNDGSMDTDFNVGQGASSSIDDVAIAPNGKILLSGNFASFNGNSNYSKLVLLNSNGSIDSSFSIGSGFDDAIEAIAFQSDGKILVGGSFLNYNGTTQNRLLRLQTNGAIDTSFLSKSGFNNGTVHTIHVTASGTILVGGSFSDKYINSEVNRLLLLNSNGTLHTNFDIGNGPSSATVYCLTSSKDDFYVGGSFTFFDDLKQGKLAKLSSTGELDSGYLTAGVGFDKAVEKIIPLADGNYLVFGSFTQYNGKPINRLARLNSNGELDTSFNPNQEGPNNTIKEVLVQTDGKLWVAGNFTKYNGVTVNRLVRLNSDGSVDESISYGKGFNYMVYSMVMQSDGKIILAGSFTTYKGTSVKKVIRLLPNGDQDPSFSIGTNPDELPNLLVLQNDGKLLVSGDFSTFNGIVANKMVRLKTDGSVDSSFNIGAGFDNKIYALSLQTDQKIIVGGSFSKYNGISNKRIVRLQADGTVDTDFNTGTGFSGGTVRSIAIQTNGSILIGGSFSGNYNGTSVKRILRVLSNGCYDNSFSLTLNGQLNSICLIPEGAVIGGNYNSVSGTSKHRIAKLKFCQDGTSWDGTSWSNGLPTLEKAVVFNANYTISTPLSVCSCEVNSPAIVTVTNEASLQMSSIFSGTGKLVFENNTSLFQSDETIVNTGKIDYKRKTTPVRRQDYTYWASPVSNQKLIILSPNSSPDHFFSYNSVGNYWFKEPISSTMVLGKGYIFQAPLSFSESIPASFEVVFSGVPNNGKIQIPVPKTSKAILIGNPYPSAIDADAFILENQQLLQGSLYFWTHNTPIKNGQYSSDDYAVYNPFGGVATAAKNAGVNSMPPNGKIASAQSFFVLGTNQQAGNVIFKNTMRLKEGNSMFFKHNKAPHLASTFGIEKHRLWLNLTNSEGLFKQILVGYASGATNGKDMLWDGAALDGNEWIDFYSLNEEQKNTIQARALPFESSDTIPIGYRTKNEGSFSLSLDSFDGVFANQKVYVEDKLENKIHDLKSGNYSFTSTKGTFDNRFVLRYQTKEENPIDSISSIQLFYKNNQIQIQSGQDFINMVKLYALDGKMLYNSSLLQSKSVTIEATPWKSKILIASIYLATGEVINRKIVF